MEPDDTGTDPVQTMKDLVGALKNQMSYLHTLQDTLEQVCDEAFCSNKDYPPSAQINYLYELSHKLIYRSRFYLDYLNNSILVLDHF